MLNKTAVGAVLLAALAISSTAMAADRDFNTAAGAVIGAAIGHNSGGRDGAIVGGILGAAVGNSLGDDRSYNRGGYYQSRPAQVYYQPAPTAVYYEPAPVYYAPQPRYSPQAVIYVEGGSHRRHGYDDRRWDERRHDRHERHYDRGERHREHAYYR